MGPLVETSEITCESRDERLNQMPISGPRMLSREECSREDERSEWSDLSERSARIDRSDRSERSDWSDRSERVDRSVALRSSLERSRLSLRSSRRVSER